MATPRTERPAAGLARPDWTPQAVERLAKLLACPVLVATQVVLTVLQPGAKISLRQRRDYRAY